MEGFPKPEAGQRAEDPQDRERKEDAPMKKLEGTELSREEFDVLNAQLPKKYRRLALRVLAEIVPTKERRGIASYAAIWELKDGRWMVVNVMLGGTDHVTNITVESKAIKRGKTEVREKAPKQRMIVGHPEEILNPRVIPRSIVLRKGLWDKLAENLKTIDGGRLARYVYSAQPTRRFVRPRTPGHNAPTDEREETRPIEGVEPPKASEQRRLREAPGLLREERESHRGDLPPTRKREHPKTE